MSRFLENAASIFEAAQSIADSGFTPSAMTILVGSEEGIRVVAGSDWPLESLKNHYGAGMVYRVRSEADRVTVEGRAGSRACLLEAEKPNWAARRLLRDSFEYTLLGDNRGSPGALTVAEPVGHR